MDYSNEKAVFAAVNTEFKSLIIGKLLSSDFRSSWQMMNDAVDQLGSDLVSEDSKLYSHHIISSRGEGPLKPFVEVEQTSRGNKLSNVFRLNNFAEQTHIQDIALFMLYSTIKFDISAWSWLGQHHLDGPHNTVRIFEEIVNNGSRQKRDLEHKLNMSGGSLAEKLNNLSDLDLLEKKTFQGKGSICYTVNGRKRVHDNNNFKFPRIARRISDFMKDRKEPFSYLDIMNRFGYVEHSRVQATLRAFERKGYLKSTDCWVGGVKYSVINATPRGLKLYCDVIEPILRFIRKDDKSALNYIKRKAIYETNIPIALSIYQASRKSSQSVSADKRISQVIEILKVGDKRYKDIESELGVKATRYLKKLVDQERVSKPSRGVYSLR